MMIMRTDGEITSLCRTEGAEKLSFLFSKIIVALYNVLLYTELQIHNNNTLEVTQMEFNTVIKHESGKFFRYNSKEALLEWVSDYELDDNLDKVQLPEGEYVVVDAVGLMRENAEADLMGYIEMFVYEIENGDY